MAGSVIPPSGRRILNIGGTEDDIIPYLGGVGVLDHTFLAGEHSTFVWAQHMGFIGEQISMGVPVANAPSLIEYSYLNGSVVHYKVVNGTHGLVDRPEVMEKVAEFINSTDH